MEQMGGEGAGIKDNFLQEELLHPTVRTGRAWVELEGRKVLPVPLLTRPASKVPGMAPAPILTPTRPLRHPPSWHCLRPVLHCCQNFSMKAMQLLQEAASMYNLEPEKQVRAWF